MAFAVREGGRVYRCVIGMMRDYLQGGKELALFAVLCFAE